MPLWFRRKDGQEAEQAPDAEAAVPSPTIVEKDPPGAPVEGSETPAPRRRGGRAAVPVAEEGAQVGGESPAEEETPPKPAARPRRRPAAKADVGDGAPAPAKPKPAASRQRRRTPTPRRATLPKLSKEMLISHDVGEQRVAVIEDGQVVEVYLGRPGRESIAGNVYKGVVDSVLPGMEASFVEIGLEKNGFLYVDEIVVPELEGKRHGRRIQELVSRGQEVLVQAVKDPMGTKGARLTTEISLPGRFLVYTPFGDGIGVSRRLEDDERERLKGICKSLELPDGGIIVRTAAEGASEEEIAGDLAFLRKLWASIGARAASAPAPSLVYREAELPLRVVRDVFRSDFERLAVDHERTYRRIVGYLKRTSPELADRVEWYRDAEPLMERHGVEAAVRSTLHRRVELPSGGSLVFDYAEAFTVVDVNTGRFVGARGKGSGARLEDTITKNNLEAAKEIVRQLRLRDVGGIIVIDFIDMANPKNRHEVEEALKRELERDRTKTYVVEISPLGLVEMTRQNVTDGPREILTTRCPACSGDGVVVSDETYAVDVERRLKQLAEASRAQALRVEVSAVVARILGGARLVAIESETGKRFGLEAREGVPSQHLAVLAEGPVSRIAPEAAVPLRDGEEFELLLEEAHLHHPEDAIGRIDGYLVSVAGAGGSVGRTARVRIERASRAAAYATLVAVDASEGPIDAGVLAEEDGPRSTPGARRRSTRTTRTGPRAAPAPRPRSRAVVEAAPPEGEPEATAPPGEDDTPTAEGTVPRKKTRRGTRGGRGRKKPADSPAAAEGTEAAPPGPAASASPGTETGSEAPAGVPADGSEEPGAEGEAPARKRTRRGTRGGRGRKRPAETQDEAAEPTVLQAGEEAVERPPTEAVDDGLTAREDGEAEDGAAARKRTRRGTRGGRGRKRSPTAGDADAEPVAAVPADG